MRHNEVPRHLAEKAAMIQFDHEWDGYRDDGKGGKRPDWDSLSDDDREERIRKAAYVLASAGEEIIGANIARDPPADMAVGQGKPSDLTGDPDKSSGAEKVASAATVAPVQADERDKQLHDPKFQREANKAADQVQKERDKDTAVENERNARLGVQPLDKKDTDAHPHEPQTEEEVAKRRAGAPVQGDSHPKPTSASLSPTRDSRQHSESAGSKRR